MMQKFAVVVHGELARPHSLCSQVVISSIAALRAVLTSASSAAKPPFSVINHLPRMLFSHRPFSAKALL